MLSIQNLTLQYGGKHLFNDVCCRIGDQDRIGLVGVNGAGKSTLLRIMSGADESGEGFVTRARYVTIGYLPQETPPAVAGRTLYQEAETAFSGVIALQNELEAIAEEMSSLDSKSDEFTELLKRHGEIQHKLEQSGVFQIRSRIEKVLTGLGFKKTDFEKDCLSFSGGWLMRLMLAKLLLLEPSLLLLDEPTNHLDMETLTWLEEFLQSCKGAMVVISHDRAFLDNVTNITWELSKGRLTAYKGNYSKYIAEREKRIEIQKAAYDNQQANIQQTMRFVERFRAKSTKASQVQSRLRQLERMEKIELEEPERNISFSFPPAMPSGKLAVSISNLTKSYDKKPVFNGLSFDLMRGDKMAVVGVNGAGKSTLLRLIAGMERPDSGEIQLGHNVKPSYFGQHQTQELNSERTVLETLLETAGPEMTITHIRSLLGAFLFREDEVDKKVKVLSGGEKSRLALARMIATPANLLLMDEPTNHLDMISQEILQEALRQYDGSLIVVSHNRYFLDGFTGKTLDIRNGLGSVFLGNISEYLEIIHNSLPDTGETGQEAFSQGKGDIEAGKTGKNKGKEARQVQARLIQERSRALNPLKRQNIALEEEIAAMEARKTALEQAMADSNLYADTNAFLQLNNEYKALQTDLERHYAKWEGIQAEIEAIEADYKQKGL
jgi:ATP-binding cassette subfamily F protein 3